MMVKELEEVVVRFSGDSGDGMQLAGNIFSNVSATVGNDICTFPDYPADIRAPQGSLTGVSGFQVHIGAGQVYTPGDRCHVLVAMNPSALKTQIKFCKPQGLIITDSDSFEARDLEKARFKTDNPFEELGIKQEVLEVPISSMCKESLKDSGLDNKSALRCKNMFALGLVCWLFNRNLAAAEKMLREKFAKKPEIAEANIKVLNDGFNYGANTHASVSTYKIESKAPKSKGLYTDINGNKATAYGLIAAAEKAGLELYLGSYPITPATDILHELAKHKSLGVKTVQCEDEIAGCASAVGAAFAGALAVTTTSGPGVCLKSEAMNLAVIGELPLVIVNVQRGGPSTGLPTKSEQTDLLQALYGRNGESPMPVIAAIYIIAFHPSDFHVARAHWNPHAISLLPKGFMMVSAPNLRSTPFTMPSAENIANVRVNTTIQLMKFGRVVKVCTSFLNLDDLISLIRIANTTGRGENSRPIRLNAKVFLSTRNSSLRLFQIAMKCCSPTNSISVSPLPAL